MFTNFFWLIAEHSSFVKHKLKQIKLLLLFINDTLFPDQVEEKLWKSKKNKSKKNSTFSGFYDGLNSLRHTLYS